MNTLVNELVNSINSNITAPFAALKNRNNILHQLIRSNDLQKPALLNSPKAPLKTSNLNLNEKLVHDWILADIEALSLLKGKEKKDATNLIKDNLSVYTVYMKKLQSVDYGLCQELLHSDSNINGFSATNEISTDGSPLPVDPKSLNNTELSEQDTPNKNYKNLLDSVTYEPNNDGSVNYFLNKNHIFTDYGQNILMAKGTDEQEEAIHAALLLAKEKYLGKFELTGTEEFKAKAIEILAKNNIKVTLSPEKYNVQLAEKNKELSASTIENGIQTPILDEPSSKKTQKRRFK